MEQRVSGYYWVKDNFITKAPLVAYFEKGVWFIGTVAYTNSSFTAISDTPITPDSDVKAKIDVLKDIAITLEGEIESYGTEKEKGLYIAQEFVNNKITELKATLK